jgi:hypothetical protein
MWGLAMRSALPGGAWANEALVDRACGLLAEPGLKLLTHRVVNALEADWRRSLSTGAILIVGSSTDDGRASRRVVREVRSLAPDLIILLARARGEPQLEDASRWYRAGVDEIVNFGRPTDLVEILEGISRRQKAPPPAVELSLLASRGEPGIARDAVLYAFRNTHRELRAGVLARLMGYSRRRLGELFESACYPAPDAACRCGRMLHVAELASLGVTSPAEQARRLGFGTAEAMRKLRSKLSRAVVESARLDAFISPLPRLIAVLGPRRGALSEQVGPSLRAGLA